MADTALLVLDMQEDIVSMHKEVKEIPAVIQEIAGLIAWARERSIPIVYSRVAFRPSYVDTMPRMPQIKQYGVLNETQPGSQIIGALKPAPEDSIVIKRRTGVFYNTDLEIVLRGLGARTLIFTGLSTPRVIESTVREGESRDFNCVVASNGCMAETLEQHRNSLTAMGNWFAEILTAAEIKKKYG